MIRTKKNKTTNYVITTFNYQMKYKLDQSIAQTFFGKGYTNYIVHQCKCRN